MSAHNSSSIPDTKEHVAVRNEWRAKYGVAFYGKGKNAEEVERLAKVVHSTKRGAYGVNGKLIQKFIDLVMACWHAWSTMCACLHMTWIHAAASPNNSACCIQMLFSCFSMPHSLLIGYWDVHAR